MHTYSFEKLHAWGDARDFVKWIYQITSSFPPEERFGLTLQMRRAAISIVSNLAEGSARNTKKDKAYFSQLAYSSTIEILNQMILSKDLRFLPSSALTEGRMKIENISRKIAALRRSQLTPNP
jgi:four helix bundle protein